MSSSFFLPPAGRSARRRRAHRRREGHKGRPADGRHAPVLRLRADRREGEQSEHDDADHAAPADRAEEAALQRVVRPLPVGGPVLVVAGGLGACAWSVVWTGLSSSVTGGSVAARPPRRGLAAAGSSGPAAGIVTRLVVRCGSQRRWTTRCGRCASSPARAAARCGASASPARRRSAELPREHPPRAEAGRPGRHPAGVDGGYRLARRRWTEITVADIIRPSRVRWPTSGAPGRTSLIYDGAAVPLRDVWLAVRANLRAVLEHVTVADIAEDHLPDSGAQAPGRPRGVTPH